MQGLVPSDYRDRGTAVAPCYRRQCVTLIDAMRMISLKPAEAAHADVGGSRALRLDVSELQLRKTICVRLEV